MRNEAFAVARTMAVLPLPTPFTDIKPHVTVSLVKEQGMIWLSGHEWLFASLTSMSR
jgi:hypothetical protein